MTTAIMAGVGSQDAFVECAARPGLKVKGKLYRKQFLNWGEFLHPKVPGGRVKVDEAFADQLIKNFNEGLSIVQVPIVDDQNKHTEDPTRNLGEVVGVEKSDKGLYALVDARKPELAKELGNTLLGASAMLDLNYTDTRTGSKVGPALLHLAITNRPYITNLDAFSEVTRLAADTSDETVLLGAAEEKGHDMTKEELIEALKAEHGIDVNALLETEAEIASLSNVLGAPEDSITISDVAQAVVELSHKTSEQDQTIASLTASNEAMRLSAAEAEVDSLIQEGRILPKQRETMLRLSLEDRETFEDLVPDDSIVSLSEAGVTTHQNSNSQHAQSEVERLLRLSRGEAE